MIGGDGMWQYNYTDECLCHYGIKGMQWGVRRYQYADGTLTAKGRLRYYKEANKNKNKQMGPTQTSKFLHSKGNPKQHEKTTHRMGENLCK